MSKNIIYLIILFLLLGLTTSVANAKYPFIQSSGDDGILAMEAENYDVNEYFGKVWKLDPNNNPILVGPHIWKHVINVSPYSPNDLPNDIVVTNPAMHSLPSQVGPNGITFKHDAAPYFDTNAPRMDYEIKFVKSGTHYLYIRGWGDNGSSNTCWVSIDGLVRRIGFSTDNNDPCDPEIYYWEDDFDELAPYPGGPAIYDVTAGYHTLSIYARETGLLIDTIVMTTNPDYDPNAINDGNGPPESLRRNPACAFAPYPDDGQTYVAPEVVLSWQPGDYVDGSPKHRIYFSEDFNDVNDGNSVAILAQQDPTYHPTAGSLHLDWGMTYYWRVDESNATTTWDEGYVWQFTVEPEYYELTYDQIDDVTASSNGAGQEPNNTVDGSGIDEANDTHTTTATDMWLTTSGPPAWIKYEFDNTYKLAKMWVWNYNEAGATNNGLQNVTIQYSLDDITYNTLGTTHTFNQATGLSNYTYNTVINLNNVVAKYVKITANTNYGGSKCGLSEVRFFYEPLRARFPVPSDGATSVNPAWVILKWRAGREAAQHKIYISDDEQAVINGTAYVATVNAPTTSYNAGMLLPIELGKTYYWKINEVNLAETPSEWVGNVWEFDTLDFLVVDDMDDYGDLIGYPWERNHRIYYVWRDGWDNDGLNGNDTGSQVYHWRGTGAGYSETTKVRSSKSMPFYYENDGGTVSKPVATWPNPDNPLQYYSEASAKTTGVSSLNLTKDWACAKALSLWFYGDPNNGTDPNERMYVALEDSSGHAKSVYYNVANGYDPLDVKEPNWHEWNIPLDLFNDANPALDVNLADVNRVHIGFGDRINPKKGTTPVSQKWFVVYFDDIRLYPARCVYSLLQPDEDLDNDCVVDYGDIAVMADNWLERDYIETGKLLLRWDFNETSGLIAHDTSGNTGRDGDVNNASWYTTGKIGRCLSFGGDGDNVSTGNDANTYMDKLHGLSVCLWIKSDDVGTDQGFIVFDYNNYSASGDRRNIRYDAAGYYSGRTNVITCGIGTTKGWQSVESSGNMQKFMAWQHIAVTWAVGEPVCLYINGVRDPGSYTNQPIALGATVGYRAVTVGKGKEDDKLEEGWDGLIDDVQIYSHKLTVADIAKVMTGATIADRPNIYYPLLLLGELHAGEAQGSRKINFKDYAVLVSDNWLKETLWPEE